jgi:hypothetical protein
MWLKMSNLQIAFFDSFGLVISIFYTMKNKNNSALFSLFAVLLSLSSPAANGQGFGINQAAPASSLHLTSPPTQTETSVFEQYAAVLNFRLRRANGTIAVPTALASGDVIANFSFGGYNSAAFTAASARVRAVATQIWTAANNGTAIEMVTTANNSNTLNTTSFLLDPSMNVGVGWPGFATAFGTNAAKVLGIANGTAPTTSPASAIQLWSANRNAVAGKGSLHVRTEDGTSHVFGDFSGIGTLTPTAILEIKAGTATASTAPLKLNTGVNLTTAEAGAAEYDGTNLYFTPASAVRETVMIGFTGTSALNFPNTAAGGQAELNITVTGAATGDNCFCSPNTALENGILWNCYVSAPNTVTVRLTFAATLDPALRTWRATVIH